MGKFYQFIIEQREKLTFLRILFVFLSHNFSRGLFHSVLKSGIIGERSYFLFSHNFSRSCLSLRFRQRRSLAVFSHITFRLLMRIKPLVLFLMVVHPKVCPPTERKSSEVEQQLRKKIFPEGLLELYTITDGQEERHRRLEHLLCGCWRLY